MIDFLASVVICIALVYAIVMGAKISVLGFKCKARPVPGDSWVFVRNSGDPWASVAPVEIVAIRKGWVRYQFSSGMAYSCEEGDFRRMYRPYEPDGYGDGGGA